MPVSVSGNVVGQEQRKEGGNLGKGILKDEVISAHFTRAFKTKTLLCFEKGKILKLHCVSYFTITVTFLKSQKKQLCPREHIAKMLSLFLNFKSHIIIELNILQL